MASGCITQHNPYRNLPSQGKVSNHGMAHYDSYTRHKIEKDRVKIIKGKDREMLKGTGQYMSTAIYGLICLKKHSAF